MVYYENVGKAKETPFHALPEGGNEQAGASSQAVIQVSGLAKRFGLVRALDGVDLVVQPGQVYGFLGPNGAGKTTTIRCLLGFIRPNQGDVQLFGQPAWQVEAGIRNRIGYLSSDALFYNSWSPAQHINFAQSVRRTESIALELAERFNLDMNTKFRKLSSGNKQKLGLVLALMHKPDLLILDEPTRGLDPLLQRELYAVLREVKARGGTVFMSSHNLSEVEQVCDEVGIIRQGKMVASDTLQSLRKMQTHVIKIVTGDELRLDEFNQLPNVEVVGHNSHELTAKVDGDFNAFMKLATKYTLHDIDISHASLEEVFLRYYDA